MTLAEAPDEAAAPGVLARHQPSDELLRQVRHDMAQSRRADSQWSNPAAAVALHDRWTLRLYVAGQSPRSLRAVANLQQICAEELQGRYLLEVIDLYQQPQLAEGEQIVAVPALIKRLPLPLRMVIGDMSNTERVLTGLDLLPQSGPPHVS